MILRVSSYIGQVMNYFKYGDEAIGAGPGTTYDTDSRLIEEKFGKSNIAVGIIPNTSIIDERNLTEELENLDFVNYAISLGGTLPEGIPIDFLPEKLTGELHTDNYARILISLNTTQESDYAFECMEKVQSAIEKYYKDGYALGTTSSTMDIKDILRSDYENVSLISLLGVAMVVMITFGSVLLPILVIIPIELAIFINMTIPYIIGSTIPYMGYIIVSCVQIGATIDYSILVTNNYIKARNDMDKVEASKAAVSRSALSVITSGSILTVVGYGLYFTSSVQGISQLGRLVGRGAVLSVILVLSLLPALLCAFDKIIKKPTDVPRASKLRRLRNMRENHELKLFGKYKNDGMNVISADSKEGTANENA